MKMSPLRKRYTPDVMCLNYVLTANNLTIIIDNSFSVGHDKQLHVIDLIFLPQFKIDLNICTQICF